MTRPRKISGLEAMNQAERWLSIADGDADEAVERVRRYERGHRRVVTLIAAIRLLERQQYVDWLQPEK